MNIFNVVGYDVNGLTQEEALTFADLNWTVAKQPIWTDGINGPITSAKHFATVRQDNQAILGIVGPDYAPVQNHELLYLCERVAKDSQITIETAGPLFGGSRVWIQLKGDCFDVGPKKDQNYTTTLFTNGHDGLWPLCSLPTSYRVVCQNTLNMAINEGRKKNMIISMKHVGDMQSRLEQMYMAIQEFKDRAVDFKEKVNLLGNTPVSTEFVQEFWTKVYIDLYGNFSSDPTTEDQKEKFDHAKSKVLKWINVFDSEVKESGANLWTAMNAVTYDLDHNQIYRGDRKYENRFNDILFGNGAKEKINVMNRALSMV